MENQIQVQELQENQSCMELTAEELAELEAVKGGASIYTNPILYFPYGIPLDIYQLPKIHQIPQIKTIGG
jgi:hypothetical protein